MHYNIKALPESYKKKVLAEFHRFYLWAEKKQIPQSLINQFKECEVYMLSEDLSKQWKNFEKETALLDEMRNESIDEVLSF